MFVTTRIAAVDLLTERLPPSRVAGLYVANGHRITDMSGEAFVVRLFRSGNRRGFVRALTDRPGDLTRGFHAIERAMKALMVRHLNLWPRFHLGRVLPLPNPFKTCVESGACCQAGSALSCTITNRFQVLLSISFGGGTPGSARRSGRARPRGGGAAAAADAGYSADTGGRA